MKKIVYFYITLLLSLTSLNANTDIVKQSDRDIILSNKLYNGYKNDCVTYDRKTIIIMSPVFPLTNTDGDQIFNLHTRTVCLFHTINTIGFIPLEHPDAPIYVSGTYSITVVPY